MSGLKGFYLAFPKVQTLSGQLSWSHYVEFFWGQVFGGQVLHRNISVGGYLEQA
jgi:hypothetical protein